MFVNAQLKDTEEREQLRNVLEASPLTESVYFNEYTGNFEVEL